MSLVVLLEFQVKPDAIDDMKALMKELLPDTRSYAGCQGVDIYSGAENPANFVFNERWESREHYQRYLAWRTETGAMDKFGAKLAGPPSIRYFNRVDV